MRCFVLGLLLLTASPLFAQCSSSRSILPVPRQLPVRTIEYRYVPQFRYVPVYVQAPTPYLSHYRQGPFGIRRSYTYSDGTTVRYGLFGRVLSIDRP